MTYRPSFGPSFNVDAVQSHLRTYREQTDASDIADSIKKTPSLIIAGAPFSEISYDLSASGIANGTTVDKTGFAIYYKREGSHPGGRLTVTLANGTVTDLTPGQRLRTPLGTFTLQRASRSPSVGTANLVIELFPDSQYIESAAGVPGEPFNPIDLLGVSTVPTFVNVSAAAPSGTGSPAFRIDGLSAVRILLDTLAANASISFDVIPWFRDLNSALWYEQSSSKVTVSYNTAGSRYRNLGFTLQPMRGYMALQVDAPSVALTGSVGAIVQGVA